MGKHRYASRSSSLSLLERPQDPSRQRSSSGCERDDVGEGRLTFGCFERRDEVEDLVIFFRPAAKRIERLEDRVSLKTSLCDLRPSDHEERQKENKDREPHRPTPAHQRSTGKRERFCALQADSQLNHDRITTNSRREFFLPSVQDHRSSRTSMQRKDFRPILAIGS